MAIEPGDFLIMTQHGVEQVVQAVSGEDDRGLVQIKNTGTFSPCPIGDLHEAWVLTDPTGKRLDSGGPIYVKPDGRMTEEHSEARYFKDPVDAIKFRDDHSEIPYFVPIKLKGYQRTEFARPANMA